MQEFHVIRIKKKQDIDTNYELIDIIEEDTRIFVENEIDDYFKAINR